MKFNICNYDGREFVFDNIDNTICLANGDIFCNKKMRRIINKGEVGEDVVAFDTNNFSSLTKDKNISKLRIQVGLNCNYSCSFCIQKDYADIKTRVATKDDIYSLLDKIEQYGINVSKNAKIEIWGGEPLVYYKTLKILLPELKDRYPKCAIKMVSNGTIVDDEKIDFLVENGVNLVFSHDAQAYFLRGKDPLKNDEIKRLWLYAFDRCTSNNLWFGINVVISQYNIDLFEIQKFFSDQLSCDVPFSFEGVVMAHAKGSVEFTKFNASQEKILHDSIFRAIFDEPNSRVADALFGRVSKVSRMLAHNISAKSILGRCDAAKSNALSIDMYGNVLSCHNVDPKTQSIGNINNYNNIKCDKFTHWSRRDNCPKCPYISSCAGACMRNNTYFHNAGCPVQKAFHGAIFDSAWTIMTGSQIKTISTLS